MRDSLRSVKDKDREGGTVRVQVIHHNYTVLMSVEKTESTTK